MRRSTPRWSGCRMRCIAGREGRVMVRPVSRRLAHLTVAAMAWLALSAWPARPEERVVNFYNWSNYMAPDVLENFTKETGIRVVYDTFDANETLETRLLAGKS